MFPTIPNQFPKIDVTEKIYVLDFENWHFEKVHITKKHRLIHQLKIII